MQLRRALKPAVAIAAALTYVASMAGMASAGTINSGQIQVSGTNPLTIDFPGAASPCTTPVAPTLTGTVSATAATVTAVDSTSVIELFGGNYLLKLSRTASTGAVVTGSSSPYTVGDFTVTLRAQLYDTTIPACGTGALRCTMNLRLGLHGDYSGAIPSSGGGTVTLSGGTGYTGGLPISAVGCPAPFNAYHGQSATISIPLAISLP